MGLRPCGRASGPHPGLLILDYERIRETRPQIAETLRKNGAEEGHGVGLDLLILMVFFAPVFHHLWFPLLPDLASGGGSF